MRFGQVESATIGGWRQRRICVAAANHPAAAVSPTRQAGRGPDRSIGSTDILSRRNDMIRSFWIAPAALAAALLFSTPSAKADRWGFSIRVGHGGTYSDCYAPRVRRDTYRYSKHRYYSYRRHSPRRYDHHGGYDVYRRGHGRTYYRGGHYRSGQYRGDRYRGRSSHRYRY